MPRESRGAKRPLTRGYTTTEREGLSVRQRCTTTELGGNTLRVPV